MSATVTTILGNIRALLNDQTGSRFIRSDEQLRAMLSSRMQMLNADINMIAKQTTACTLVAGTDEYTLDPSTSTKIHSAVTVIRASDKWPLIKIGPQTMFAYKRNSGSSTQGRPTYYMLYETSAQALKIVLYPTPGQADTLDMWHMDIPGILGANTDSVPFGEYAIRGLEKAVAAEVLLGSPDETVAAVGLTKDLIPLWQADAKRLFNLEEDRTARISRPGGIVRVVS